MRRPLAVGLMAVFAGHPSAQAPKPSFAEATIAGIERPNRARRELTTTTLFDQTNLLQLIVSAYLDADAAPLLTAVQEQLGLKLEPARGPVNVLIIDRVEQLTAEK